MKQEQAREIAETVFSEWRVCGGTLRHMIADALHAAYEAERGAVSNDAARLASIKETARRIFSKRFTATGDDDSLRSFYPTPAFDDALIADCDAAVRFAEALEDAFERRYGGGS